MSDLLIRPATAKDLPALLALYTHLSPHDPPCPSPLAEERFAQFQNYAGSTIFVGTWDDALVTSCALVIVPNLSRNGRPYGLVENVVTHRMHRQKGYGTSILDAACAHAWAHDCYKVMLMTGSQSTSTLRFYEQAGFTQSKTGFQKRATGF
ncbi:MAG: GNAT family N-acetyltransferase [Pseudomonadota bacterium]